MTVDGSAVWANSSSLEVNLGLFRPDSDPNGTSKLFSGEGIFNYTFTVSSDTTVAVDYGVLGTSTHTTFAANAYVWWAMQAYKNKIDGSSIETISFPGNLDPFQASPFIDNGSVVANIIAGTHTVTISSSNGATGNQSGDRAQTGTFGIQIGPAMPDLLPGDANGDSKIDGLDYLIWAGAFGDDPAMDPPGPPENGDFNEDGKVDGLDYLTWASNFGQGPNDGVAVPETASALLAVMGAFGLLATRRRRR
jgi:hypothetical protein